MRWVMQVGDANFDENDDDWWWTDEEYPDAVGVYVTKLHNLDHLDRHSALLAWLDPVGRCLRSLWWLGLDYPMTYREASGGRDLAEGRDLTA